MDELNRHGGPPRGEPSAELAAMLRGDVASIATMPAERVPTLLAEVLSLQLKLAAVGDALHARSLTNGGSGARQGCSEPLLDVQAAAERLGMSADWLYRHARQLPFTRRVGRRAVKFDPEGLARWVATQRRG